MVDGGFDPLHEGHLAYFEAAARLGLPVLCVAAPDEYIEKKHPPLLGADARAAVLDSLRAISYVYLRKAGESTADVLMVLRPRYYVKGNGWGGVLPERETAICKEQGIEIVFTDTKINSSSGVLDEYLRRAAPQASARDLAAFEDLFFHQEAIPASHYEEAYFMNNWREGENNYRLQTRRRIEGRGPALVKENFAPERVLDVGCGPGAMMELLREQGISADGMDVSPACKTLAPEKVREHIIIADITNPSLETGGKRYDLVICREVLEHLTARQIVQAVTNICRLSSRYAYITTRFHQRPQTMLSVSDDKAMDPSHITVFNQDFLRLLFILRGFARRPDLERRMDWLNKQRVLVYEKQT